MSDRAVLIWDQVADVSGIGRPGRPVSASLISVSPARFTGTTPTTLLQPTTASTTTLANPGAGPVAAPVVTLNVGAGAATAGNYLFGVSFTINGVETAVGTFTAPLTAANGDGFHWASIPTGPTGSTTARTLYRSIHGGTVLHQVATIADNTTTTYTDNTLSDATLANATVGLQVGGWRLSLNAPGDITPAGCFYLVVVDGIPNYTTAFSYSATPVQLSTIISSASFAAPSVVMTILVATIQGPFDAGDIATVRLSTDSVSTISGELFTANVPFQGFVAADGTLSFALPRNDQLTPSGSFYTLQVGKKGTPITFLAPAGGGDIWVHRTGITTPGDISYDQTSLTSTLTPQVDDPVTSPTTLADDISNLDERTKKNARTLTANTTLNAVTDDVIFVDGTGGGFTVTLPAQTARHRPYWIIKVDSVNNVTIARAGSDTINGSTSVVLSGQWSGLRVEPKAGSSTAWVAMTSGGGGGGGSASFSWTAKTANYTMTSSDSGILVDVHAAAAGYIVITLPSATGITQTLAIKKSDSSANPVYVETTSSQTIDGSLLRTLAAQNAALYLGSDGSNWYQLDPPAQMGIGADGLVPATVNGDALWIVPSLQPGTAGAVEMLRTDGDLPYRKAASLTTLVIGFIGDSITSNFSIPATTATNLSINGLTVTSVNAGVSGTSTSDWGVGSSNLTTAIGAFVSGGVKLIQIALGVNDARAAVNNSASTYRSQMQAIVSYLVSLGYVVALQAPTYCTPGSNAGDQTVTSNALRIAYQPMLAQIANGRTVFLADTKAFYFFQANSGQLSDGIHPNSTGQTNLTGYWANGLRPVVGALTQELTRAALSIGTAGQVLTVVSGYPAWAAASGGGSSGGRLALADGITSPPEVIVSEDGASLVYLDT